MKCANEIVYDAHDVNGKKNELLNLDFLKKKEERRKIRLFNNIYLYSFLQVAFWFCHVE